MEKDTIGTSSVDDFHDVYLFFLAIASMVSHSSAAAVNLTESKTENLLNKSYIKSI